MRCQCIICTDDFNHTADIACLPCGHTFHLCCLEQWMESNPSCPTCRRKVKVRDVRKVFLTSLDSTIQEPETLQSDLSDAKMKLLELRQKVAELRETQGTLEERLEKSETSLAKTKSKYQAAFKKAESLQGSLQLMKTTLKENSDLKDTIARLQETIEKSRHLNQVLQGTERDVEELLKLYGASATSVRQIALYCVSLKRELETAKNEVRVSRGQISSANSRRIALENELASKMKELTEVKAEANKFREQCYVLTERLENLPELQAGALRRPSSEAEGLAEKRLKRSKSIVPSPPVLKARLNVGSKPVKFSTSTPLPGYTKMKITPALKKPEAPIKPSNQDELLLKLMKSKAKSTDFDSIQRKGYNGLGGHSSHIQTAKRIN